MSLRFVKISPAWLLYLQTRKKEKKKGKVLKREKDKPSNRRNDIQLAEKERS